MKKETIYLQPEYIAERDDYGNVVRWVRSGMLTHCTCGRDGPLFYGRLANKHAAAECLSHARTHDPPARTPRIP